METDNRDLGSTEADRIMPVIFLIATRLGPSNVDCDTMILIRRLTPEPDVILSIHTCQPVTFGEKLASANDLRFATDENQVGGREPWFRRLRDDY